MNRKHMTIGAVAVLAVAVLAFAGKCMDDADHGRGGKYTGKSFVRVFLDDADDEGVIYKLSDTPAIKVLFPVDGDDYGYVVEYDKPGNETCVYVETAEKSYKAKESLGNGYYIRRGEEELQITALDDTVSDQKFPRYVEVTHQGTLEEIAKTEAASK